MGAFKKISKFIFNPIVRFGYLNKLGLYRYSSDERFLRKAFKVYMKSNLNLINPRTFNEKLQWLKLYDRKPIYTTMVDKYLVREYIAEKLGEEYLIPLLGVWDDSDDIDFDALPNQFVLKCNHNSGLGMCICKDKSKLDIKKVKRELSKGLKQDYYLTGREWPYKNVPRKIICEKFMSDESEGLVDYKFFCFDGKVDCVMVCLDRHLNDTKFYFFDEHWELKCLNKRGLAAPEGFTVRKPECIEQMFNIARQLSKGIPFVRVDLYECGGQIYFGEMTFFPDSGFDANILPDTDKYFGDMIKLDKVDDI